MATTIRNVRIDAELWDAAREKAELEGRSVSEVIREYLLVWVTKPPKQQEKPKIKTWRD